MADNELPSARNGEVTHLFPNERQASAFEHLPPGGTIKLQGNKVFSSTPDVYTNSGGIRSGDFPLDEVKSGEYTMTIIKSADGKTATISLTDRNGVEQFHAEGGLGKGDPLTVFRATGPSNGWETDAMRDRVVNTNNIGAAREAIGDALSASDEAMSNRMRAQSSRNYEDRWELNEKAREYENLKFGDRMAKGAAPYYGDISNYERNSVDRQALEAAEKALQQMGEAARGGGGISGIFSRVAGSFGAAGMVLHPIAKAVETEQKADELLTKFAKEHPEITLSPEAIAAYKKIGMGMIDSVATAAGDEYLEARKLVEYQDWAKKNLPPELANTLNPTIVPLDKNGEIPREMASLSLPAGVSHDPNAPAHDFSTGPKTVPSAAPSSPSKGSMIG